MAGERTLPGLGLTGFWDPGTNGWDPGMDSNLRTLSALVQASVASRTTALPGSPANGDRYIVPVGAPSNANQIAIRDDGVWVYATPAAGWLVYVVDDAALCIFDGTAWSELETGGGGLADAPSDGTVYARQDGAWVEVTTGGGTSLVPQNPSARYFRMNDMASVGGGGWNVGVSEFELRDTDGIRVPGTATASTQFSGTFAIANGYDGNDATAWSSTQPTGAWFAVDLGTVHEIATLRIKPRGGSSYQGAPATLMLQTSDDDVNWTDWLAVTTGITNDAAVVLDLVKDVEVAGGGGGLADAPSDGTIYGRQDGAWVEAGSALSIQEDGSAVGVATTLNFTGDVVVTESAGVVTVEVTSTAETAARYWRCASLGAGRRTAREMEFRDGNGTKLPGSVSASSIYISQSSTFGYDGDPATHWSAGTSEPDAWYQIDLGAGNEASVGSIYWQAHDTVGPDATFVLQHSDDGTNWTTISTITHDGVWTAGQEKTFDVSGDTGARETIAAITLQQDDVNVVGEMKQLNLEGTGFSITDEGGGKATVAFTAIPGLTVEADDVSFATEIKTVNFEGTGFSITDEGSNKLTFRLNAPDKAIVSRYWRISNLGSGRRAAREIRFLDADDQPLSGSYSASSVRISNSATNAGDGNPATYWEAATAESNAWFAVDFGAAVTANVAGLTWRCWGTLGPQNGFSVDVSEDGTNWTSVATVNHSNTYVDDQTFTFSFDTIGSYDALSIQIALDDLYGNDEWRSAGSSVDYIDVDTSVLSGADDGKTLVWSNAAGAFVISTGAPSAMLLGGGQEILLEQALSGETSVVIDVAGHDLDQYDELTVIFRGANGRFDIELSADGGLTTQDVIKFFRADTDGAAAHTQVEFGPDTDNGADSLGIAHIRNLIPGVPTTVETFGSRVGGNSQHMSAVAQDTAATTAVTIAKEDGLTFSTGTLWVIGTKKNRQPMEVGGRYAGTWAAGATILSVPTMGLRVRPGAVGVLRVNAAPGADTDVEIRDQSGTTVATATIGAAATSAVLTAATDRTISEEVVLHGVDAQGSIGEITFVLRGEFA